MLWSFYLNVCPSVSPIRYCTNTAKSLTGDFLTTLQLLRSRVGLSLVEKFVTGLTGTAGGYQKSQRLSNVWQYLSKKR